MPGALMSDMRTFVVGLLLSSATAFAQTAPPADAPAPAASEATPKATPDQPSPPTAPAPGQGPPTFAEPKPRAVPVAPMTIVIDDLPQACRDIGKLAQAPNRTQSLSARISLANCLVEQKLRGAVLCDCEQSVREIETASEQTFALLDEVFLFGDPTLKILARQAQGDLLASLATRMLSTVPAPADSNEASIALRDTRVALLRPLIDPWLVRAQAAFTELDRIARANPQLSNNTAVVNAVRTSRMKLAQVQGGIAKR